MSAIRNLSKMEWDEKQAERCAQDRYEWYERHKESGPGVEIYLTGTKPNRTYRRDDEFHRYFFWTHDNPLSLADFKRWCEMQFFDPVI